MPSTRTDPTGRGRHPWWMAAVGAVLLVAGLASWYGHVPGLSSPGDARLQAAEDSPSARATAAEVTRARWEPGAPRRVLIPGLGVNAPVVPVTAPGRTLVPPSDPQQLGWWADGARPGAEQGSSLVAGHTVHTGGGALDDLEQLRRGERVTVRTSRGSIGYDVRRVAVYGKGSLTEHAEQLFSQEVPGRLVLLTCEDWDGQQYLSNVVVIATPSAR